MATKTGPTNLYHRRLVAEASAKACWVCYKLSTTVLITPEQDDWFHVCAGHLSDRKFAVAKDGEEHAKRQREAEINAEIETIKKELAEKKLQKKQAKKDGKKAGDAKKEEAKADEGEVDKEEQEKEEKIRALEKEKQPEKAKVDGPRVFELDRAFFAMRLQKKREAEMAKRNRERLRNASTFPSVPSGGV